MTGGIAVIFTLSTQMISHWLAGIYRHFYMYPAVMILSMVFLSCALFHAFHNKTKSDSVKSNSLTIFKYQSIFPLSLDLLFGAGAPVSSGKSCPFSPS